MNSDTGCSINNTYKLEGRVPIAKAIPFGLQHILTMFASNLAPITIIAGAAQPVLSQAQTTILPQNAVFVAGIATMIQLYPIWRIDSKLPVVTGVSLTFVTVLSTIATNYDYPAVMGAMLIGGIFEDTLGPLVKYWRRIITPMVATSVVTAIGFPLSTVGVKSFGDEYADDFDSAQNLVLGTITLLTCLLWNIFTKEYLRQLSILAGLIVEYIIAIFLGKMDLSLIMSGGITSSPHLSPFMPEFHAGAIISACIIFLVSAAETIGDTSALASDGLSREITGKETSGSLVCDGYASALSTVFGCPPVTSFSQNMGLVAVTEVVNRLTTITGAACMILAGLLPPVGNFFASLPQTILGGCTIMIFGTILTSDVQMIARCGFSQRNIVIVSLSLTVGISFTTASEIGIWDIFPELVQSVSSANVAAVVFVVSVFLSLVLPKDMDIKVLKR